VRTGRARFGASLVLLAACAACGGRSRVLLAGSDRTDAGGLTTEDAATHASDASVPEPVDASDDAPDETTPCLVTSFETRRTAREIIFGVPASDAMNRILEDGRTAYEATAASLTEIFERLEPRDYVGLELNPDLGDCGSTNSVTSMRLDQDDQLARLTATLARFEPWGAASVLSLLRSASVSRASYANQTTVVVVFLDGAPVLDFECEGGPAALEKVAAELASLADQGVARTVFVAAPGSNAGDQARALAELGGCPDCFVDYSDIPNFADESFGLMTLPGEIEPCGFPLPSPPEGESLDLASVTLVATFDDSPRERIPRLDDCADAPGFTLSDDGYVTLCPTTCDRMLDAFSTHFGLTSECTGREPEPDPQDAGEDAPLRTCTTQTLTSQPPKDGVVLAVPASSAMAGALPGEPRTRFEATRDSIVDCLSELERSPHVGLVVNPTEGACSSVAVLEAAPLAEGDQRERLVAALAAVAEPQGTASPLWQLRHARAVANVLPPDVHTSLLIFMDGAPSDVLRCSAEDTLDILVGELTRILDTGAQTPYLVATPGSGAGGLAQSLAERIGCPGCALDFSEQPDFRAPLMEILSGNRSHDIVCDFPIPVPPGDGRLDLDSVTVTLTLDEAAPEVLPRRVECDGAAGFTIIEGPAIVLCPATCAVLAASLAPTMTIDACSKP
jgi:hypothetical protein